jgi:hypothetical protein
MTAALENGTKKQVRLLDETEGVAAYIGWSFQVTVSARAGWGEPTRTR